MTADAIDTTCATVPASLRPGARRRARRYCLAVFSIALAIACAVAAFNVATDLKGIYWLRRIPEGGAQVKHFVEVMTAAPLGVGDPNCCERLVKLELARRSTADCFVTGSSHEMQIRRDIAAHCRSMANLTVYGGGFEDLLTLLYAAIEHGSGKTVFIGIDPWDLRRNSDARWQQFSNAYVKARGAFALPPVEGFLSASDVTRLTNLFSLDYAYANLKVLLDPGLQFPTLTPQVATASTRSRYFLPDGSMVYERSYVEEAPLRRPDIGVSDIGLFKISEPYVEADILSELAQALTVVTGRGDTPVLLLTPYAPAIFNCAAPSVCDALTAVEKAVRRLGAEQGVAVIGSYDGRRFSLTSDEYYDSMHLTPGGLGRVFQPAAMTGPAGNE